MTDLQKLSDRLDDAMKAFADENGDGFGNLDHLGARDYRDDGYVIASDAMMHPAGPDREAFVETTFDYLPAEGRDVVMAAARYRLAELEDENDRDRMWAEEAEDRRRDNPLEPDFRRIGQ